MSSKIDFVALCESVLEENLLLLNEADYQELLRLSMEAAKERDEWSEASTPEQKDLHLQNLKDMQQELLDELNDGELAAAANQEDIQTIEEFDEIIDNLTISLGSKLEGLANLKTSMIANNGLGLASNPKFRGKWNTLFKRDFLRNWISRARNLLGRNL